MENKEIYYIEESQEWVCPMAGRWKVIAVGGGASGGGAVYASSALTTYPPTAGGTTSFGDVISANGGVATNEICSSSTEAQIGGYGGYNGFTFGGVPSLKLSNSGGITFSPAGGNNTMAYANERHSTPTAALGWGAGGGSLTSKSSSSSSCYVIPGRAGDIRTTIVSIDEGDIIPCTVGAGGVAADATDFKFANGADGVIILQYLGA